MGKVRLAFLGPPSIERDGASVHLDTRKAIALMAYLSVIGKPVGRDTLVDPAMVALWQDGGTRRAPPHAFTLRNALGREYIDAERETVCLPESGGYLDRSVAVSGVVSLWPGATLTGRRRYADAAFPCSPKQRSCIEASFSSGSR